MFTEFVILYPFFYVQVVNGTLTLQFKPDEIYTMTSLTVGQHGFAGPPPEPAPFPIPYKDDFDSKSVCYTRLFIVFSVSCYENLSQQCVFVQNVMTVSSSGK